MDDGDPPQPPPPLPDGLAATPSPKQEGGRPFPFPFVTGLPLETSPRATVGGPPPSSRSGRPQPEPAGPTGPLAALATAIVAEAEASQEGPWSAREPAEGLDADAPGRTQVLSVGSDDLETEERRPAGQEESRLGGEEGGGGEEEGGGGEKEGGGGEEEGGGGEEEGGGGEEEDGGGEEGCREAACPEPPEPVPQGGSWPGGALPSHAAASPSQVANGADEKAASDAEAGCDAAGSATDAAPGDAGSVGKAGAEGSGEAEPELPPPPPEQPHVNGRRPAGGDEAPPPPSAPEVPPQEGPAPAPAPPPPPAGLPAPAGEWEARVAEQREALAQSNRSRAELRSEIEAQQALKGQLEAEQLRLINGGAAADIEARRRDLEASLDDLVHRQIVCSEGLPDDRAEVAAERRAAAEAAEVAADCALRSEVQEERRRQLEKWAMVAAEAATAAEERLESMISVEDVQAAEAKAKGYREAFDAAEGETRRLRVALADALASSGADLPNALQELRVLRDSVEGSAKRMEALEAVNAQLQGKIGRLEEDIAALRKGTTDLRSEEDLMREVILQHSEHLLRKVEDLTDERLTADADRRQLLSIASDLLAKVESGEARIARRPDLESQCRRLSAAGQGLAAEVERLRRTNAALCQQVLGEDGEGPLAGALAVAAADADDDARSRELHEEVCRLVRGRPLQRPVVAALPAGTPGAVRHDAAALSLQLQQLLAEREEAFWVERQGLSDRVAVLERARGGRTGALLRQYDAAARGAAAPATGDAGGPSALAAAPAAAAAAVVGGVRRLRETVLGAA